MLYKHKECTLQTEGNGCVQLHNKLGQDKAGEGPNHQSKMSGK